MNPNRKPYTQQTSQDCHSPYDELASADQSEYSATTTATTVTGGLNDVAAALSGNVLLSLVDAATGEPVDEACTNLEAWRAGCLLLVDGIGRYRVRVNAPYVASVAAAGHPMVGYPLVGCATGMQHCTDDDLQWRWYRASTGAGAGAEAASESGESCTAHGLDLVGEGRAYTPTCHDLGCVLTVEATALPPPRDNGQDDVQCCPPAATRMSRMVVTAPPRLAARARAAALDFDPSSTASSSPYCVPIVYPSSSLSSRLRVMTYNVLADAYSHTWGAMYPYLTPEMADPERRLLLAMEDVCLVAPDVVALQEVDRKWYHAFWVPQMAAAGYAPVGTLTEKTGLTREGCAMFCRSDRWKVARVKSVGLKEAGPMPGEETTAAWVRTQPHLCHALSKISTVAQLAVLEPLEGKEVALVVANTHLFFHPGAVHLRCLQARWLLRHADEMRQQYREELSTSEGKVSKAAIGLVICGDFNGEPSDGVIRFITRGQLGAGDSDWALGSVFRWGGTSSRAAAAELIALSPGEGELCDGRESQVAAHEGSNASTQMQDLDSRHQRLGRMAASWRAAANVEQGARAACGVVQPSGSPLAIAQAHARAGCTFKTCTAVAVYTLRRDAGMSPSTTLPGLSRVSYPGLDTNGDEGNIGNEVEETGGGSPAADVVATRGAGIATVREVETAKAAELTAAESAELVEVAAAVRWELAAHRSSMHALCDEAEAEEALTLVDIDGGRGVNEGGGASVDDGGLSLASDRQLCVQQPIIGSRSAVDGGANNESERWAARAVGPCAMNLRHPLTLVKPKRHLLRPTP